MRKATPREGTELPAIAHMVKGGAESLPHTCGRPGASPSGSGLSHRGQVSSWPVLLISQQARDPGRRSFRHVLESTETKPFFRNQDERKTQLGARVGSWSWGPRTEGSVPLTPCGAQAARAGVLGASPGLLLNCRMGEGDHLASQVSI